MLKQGPNLEIVRGDVFQYATLPKALGDANVVIVATGAADPLDPLGPFNVDYQVRSWWVELSPGACGKGVDAADHLAPLRSFHVDHHVRSCLVTLFPGACG